MTRRTPARCTREAGHALIRHGFDALGFAVIDASTDAANEASVRLMERLGLRFQRRAVAAGLDTLFYRVARAEWAAASRGA